MLSTEQAFDFGIIFLLFFCYDALQTFFNLIFLVVLEFDFIVESFDSPFYFRDENVFGFTIATALTVPTGADKIWIYGAVFLFLVTNH